MHHNQDPRSMIYTSTITGTRPASFMRGAALAADGCVLTYGMLNKFGAASRIGAMARRTGKANVDTRKFSEYIFKDGVAPGKDVVYKNLGYNANDSELLTQIYKNKEQQSTPLAIIHLVFWINMVSQRINIAIELNGIGNATGKTSYLNTGWMIQPDGSISLNTPFAGFTK